MTTGMNERSITDAIKKQLFAVGWPPIDMLEQPRVTVARGKIVVPDLVLGFNLYPLAVMEIKSKLRAVDGDAFEQAYQTASMANVPFAVITNGEQVHQINVFGHDVQELKRLPSPMDLWRALGREWDAADPRLYPPYRDGKYSGALHQWLGVARALDAIESHQKRILLAMPTGAGITYVSLQIAWKLIKSGRFRKLLYLSDRNVDAEFAQEQFAPLSGTSAQAGQGTQNGNRVTAHFSTIQSFARDYGHVEAGNYELIFIRGSQKREAYDLFGQFTDTVIVGYSEPSATFVRDIEFFGRPVYEYSMQDLLELKELNPPKGFRSLVLREVAKIESGARLAQLRTGDVQGARYYVSGKDIQPDGTVIVVPLTTLDAEPALDPEANRRANPITLLQPGDIVIPVMSTGVRTNVGMITDSLPGPTACSDSVILIRVDRKEANADEVAAFLRSDVGGIVLRRFSLSASVSTNRLTVRTVSEIPIFLPQPSAKIVSKESLTAAGTAIRRIKADIIPILEQTEALAKNSDDVSGQLSLAAEHLRSLAAVLAPPLLSDRVMTTYPAPIAMAYRRFSAARFNVYEQVLRLKDVFESAAFFTYNVILGDLFRRLDPVEFFIEDNGARRAYNGYSMAPRMDCVANVIDIARRRGNEHKLFMSELVRSTVATSKQVQEQFRNRISHTATATEGQQRAVLEEFKPIVESILMDLEFLQSYRLVRVPSMYYTRGQWIRRMEIYQGTDPFIEELPVSKDIDTFKAEYNHLVLVDTDDRVLDLHPLYQIITSKETRHEPHICFFKQRKVKAGLLEGESVQGAFEVNLDGFEEFNSLAAKILDKKTSPDAA